MEPTCLSIHLFILPFICPSIHLTIPLSIHSSYHPSVHSSDHLSIFLFNHPSVLTFIHPSIHSDVYLSILLSIDPSVRLSVQLFKLPNLGLNRVFSMTHFSHEIKCHLPPYTYSEPSSIFTSFYLSLFLPLCAHHKNQK